MVPVTKMVNKGKNILESYYIESGKHKEYIEKYIEKLIDEGVLSSNDRKMAYLLKLGVTTTNEHKIALSKVLGIISNHKFES